MSKISIHELSFCEKEDSELHDVLGGDTAFLKISDNFLSQTKPVAFHAPDQPVANVTTDAVLLPANTYVESVQETVVKDGGYYGQAKVTRGRTNSRKFVRATSSARI
ncbi:MAG: hypothetical protein AAFV71_25220 [Cyanobacteria bacterium J06633_8]